MTNASGGKITNALYNGIEPVARKRKKPIKSC